MVVPSGAYGPDSSAAYVRMFRYVADMVAARGADNIHWVFCPNAESVPDADWNRIAAYYPGAAYVDAVGMDGYNWGTTRTLSEHGWDSRWQSFQAIFQAAGRDLRTIAPGKSLFVFETASVTHGASREAWIAEMFDTLNAWDVRGVVWFQADKENQWWLALPADASAIQTVRRHIAPAQQWLYQQ
ncbi:MAG: glycosyl hydrolase [Thermodesulfobacteriota bacterium]|nr:glycosyl hydrolase [Thermodesulfobacteriota bacterium]